MSLIIPNCKEDSLAIFLSPYNNKKASVIIMSVNPFCIKHIQEPTP